MAAASSRQDSAIRVYLPRGIYWARGLAVALCVVGLVQLALHVGEDGDTSLAVVGAFEMACGAALAVLWWLRCPMTRVDAYGIAVRDRTIQLAHHQWADIVRLEPDGPSAASSVLHLRDGRVVRLPGIYGAEARRLALATAERQRGSFRSVGP